MTRPPARRTPATGRRAVLTAAVAIPFGLAGCGLSERPYLERREWPLAVARPAALPPPRHAPTLLLRVLRAGPAVQARGLQTIQPDGSVQTAFYDEWAAPPAEAVEASLRAWLAASGLFAAVLAPGSRATPDLVLEGELVALVADPGAGVARASLSYVLLRGVGLADMVVTQAAPVATAPLAGRTPAEEVAAMRAAVATLCGEVERGLARYARRGRA